MAHKKHRKPSPKPVPSKREPLSKRHIMPTLIGLLLITAGVFLGWDRSFSSAPPDWVDLGPIIDIYSETSYGEFNARCYVEEEGQFTLKLGAGKHLDKPFRAWIWICDLDFPFHWEVLAGEVENRLLFYEKTSETVNSDTATPESGYPIERRFISQKTNCISGESIGWFNGGIYTEYFTVVINPKEETSCEIKFQMDPQHAEYKAGGDVIVRMPCITTGRSSPIYDMSAGDIKALFDDEQYDMLPYFSNCMIDEAPLFETHLQISGNYASEYILDPNYIINNILPAPERLLPAYSWEEDLQWIPFLSFHDLRYDRSQLIYTWISGILIAVGSGLTTLPLSDWIQSAKKGRGKLDKPRF